MGISLSEREQEEQVFKQQLDSRADIIRRSFNVALKEQESQMVLLASFVAADPEIQELFQYGKQMVRVEGGGKGGPESQRLRQALLEKVADSWKQLQQTYHLRQLHFHLPPATSFLRVHEPGKFGDDLSSIRQIIVDSNHAQTPLTGFETGRIYSGIRGVVPVWYTRQDGSKEHIGSLEAGASVDSLLGNLSQFVGGDLAVLLKRDQVEGAVWNSYRPTVIGGCNCYIESTTSPQLAAWLKEGSLSFSPQEQDATSISTSNVAGQRYAWISFPLYDYKGKGASPVGRVVAWQNITTQWNEHQKGMRKLELMLLASYLLTQLLLMLLLYRLRGLMQGSIDQATAAAKSANSQLVSVLKDSPVVTYRQLMPGNSLDYISPNCHELTGYSDQEILNTPDWWSEQVHPLDRHLLVQNNALMDNPDNATRLRYRLRHRSGRWMWLEDRCRLTELNNGQQVLHGALVDISAQQHAEYALEESERTLRRAQAIGHVGSWEYQFADRMMTLSDEASQILGLTAGTVTDYALFMARVHPEDREQVETAWHEAMTGAGYDLEHRIVVNGETRWVRSVADFQHDESGVLLATGMLQDITRQKTREQELHRLATKDMLTGLSNRRHFMQRMEQERSRVQRFGSPCGLLMIDLDHFKQVNDRFGHAVGDEALKLFAEVATAQLRDIDTLGRLGGEEFAILLPGADIEGAYVLAERLRRALADAKLGAIPELQLTASIGVSVLTLEDASSDEPLLRADRAVYSAKSMGRNRVVRSDGMA